MRLTVRKIDGADRLVRLDAEAPVRLDGPADLAQRLRDGIDPAALEVRGACDGGRPRRVLRIPILGPG